jgi:hypothetical protein
MRKQVEAWQKRELTDVTAKVVIYEAFVEGRLEAPKHLARNVHDLYFESYALQSVTVLLLGVLLRGAAEPSNHPSRFLGERSGDFGGDTSPHNRDIILGQIDRSNDDVVLSVDGSEKRYRCRNYSSVGRGET